MRCAPAAAALIEQDDAIGFWIEESSPTWPAARAGTSMKDDRWLSSRVASHVPIDMVPVADVEHAAIEGFNVRIERHFVGLADQPRPRPAHVGRKSISTRLPVAKSEEICIAGIALKNGGF